MSNKVKGWSMSELVATCGQAVSGASAQYTVPVVGATYDIIAVGTSVYALGGSNPTADTTTNYSMIFPEGVLVEGVVLKDSKIAVISTGGAGIILFKRRAFNV